MTGKRIGFFLGLISSAGILFAPVFPVFLRAAQELVGASPQGPAANDLAFSMQTVLALLVLMVVWWLTEAIPLPATALLPLIVLPWLHTVGIHNGETVQFTLRTVLLNYASPVIFLFLGGFLLAGAMQKWNLDRRLTLWFLTRGSLANDTRTVLLGVMAVTAFLSMWISNTATAAMMLPLGIGILGFLNMHPGSSRFGTALMLGIAWSASIGGIGTVIGTPPNGIALGILDSTFSGDTNYHSITFLDWMKFGVPFVILFVPVAWWVLLRLNPPELTRITGGKSQMQQQRESLGPLSRGQLLTIAVFALTVLLWVSNPFWSAIVPDTLAKNLRWVDEYAIGVFGGVVLFLIPVSIREGTFLLEWRDTRYVDWGTLLLFGGGIALSDAMFRTGVASIIAMSFVGMVGTPSTLVLLILLVVLVDFLTEVTSNTAVTSMMVPIVISIGLRSGANPVTLAVGTAVAASLAFMFPVATPPNALLYSSGFIDLRSMIRSGIVLDLAGWIFTILVLTIIADRIFGVISF